MEDKQTLSLASTLSATISTDWMPQMTERTQHDPHPVTECNHVTDTITPLTLAQGYKSGEIVSWEWVQRIAQWLLARKISFLDATLHTGIHIPEIVLVEVPEEGSPYYDEDYARLRKEFPNVKYIILDGAHRMRTLTEYMEGGLSCTPPRTGTGVTSNKSWDELTRTEQKDLLNKKINIVRYYDTPSDKLGPIFVAVNSMDKVSSQQKRHSSGGTFKHWFVTNMDKWVKKHPWMAKMNVGRANDQEVLQCIINFETPEVDPKNTAIQKFWDDYRDEKYSKLGVIKNILAALEDEYATFDYIKAKHEKAAGASYWVDNDPKAFAKGHVMCVFICVGEELRKNNYSAKNLKKLVKFISQEVYKLHLDKTAKYVVNDEPKKWETIGKSIRRANKGEQAKRLEVLREVIVNNIPSDIPTYTPAERDLSDIDFRRKLWERQEGRCIYTGDPIDVYDMKGSQPDHIEPRSEEGSDSDDDNFALVTEAANKSKLGKPFGEGPGKYSPPTGWRPGDSWVLPK